MQVVRRLRALLEALRAAVRPEGTRGGRRRGSRAARPGRAAAFGDYPDLDRARTANRQGMGGPLGLAVAAPSDEGGHGAQGG